MKKPDDILREKGVFMNSIKPFWDEVIEAMEEYASQFKEKKSVKPKIEEIALELIQNGVQVEGVYNMNKERNEFIVNGFYKSGTATLVEENGVIIANCRYNQKTIINEVSDLVHLNYEWWQSSKNRYDGWINPCPNWIPLLEKHGLITKTTTTTVAWE